MAWRRIWLVLGIPCLLSGSVHAQIKVVTIPPPGAESTANYCSEATQTQQPYLLRPGHYVSPAPYSPDYWSPHIRPFPDYSGLHQPRTMQERSFGVYSIPSGACNGYGSCASSYGAPFGYGQYGGDVDSAYNQGRYDADRDYLWFIASHRAGRLINQSARQFDEGLRLFRTGDYERALVNWLGAADANHDSAAPRLHAGHALFALGRYREAVPLLARAFELQPGLAFKTYDIREEYGDPNDFDAQLAALRNFVSAHANDAGGLTMLGYMTYYTEGPGAADDLLRRAARRDPASYFIPKLLDVSSRGRPAHQAIPAVKRSTRKTKPQPVPASNNARLVHVRSISV